MCSATLDSLVTHRTAGNKGQLLTVIHPGVLPLTKQLIMIHSCIHLTSSDIDDCPSREEDPPGWGQGVNRTNRWHSLTPYTLQKAVGDTHSNTPKSKRSVQSDDKSDDPAWFIGSLESRPKSWRTNTPSPSHLDIRYLLVSSNGPEQPGSPERHPKYPVGDPTRFPSFPAEPSVSI